MSNMCARTRAKVQILRAWNDSAWTLHLPAIILSCLLMVCAASAQDSYANLLREGQAFLDAEKAESALAKGVAAVKLAQDRYEAYVLCALAYSNMGDAQMAQGFLAKALERAPEDQKARLREMSEALSPQGRRASVEKHVAAATKALSQGKTATAAEEYLKAWRAEPSEADLGFRGAQLLAQIEDWPTCTKTLRELISTADAKTAEAAKSLLANVEQSLEPMFTKLLEDGTNFKRQAKYSDAFTCFNKASALFPTRWEPYYEGARSCAAENAATNAVSNLQGAFARGFRDRNRFTMERDFWPLIGRPDFDKLVLDAFGQATVDEVKLAPQKLLNSAKGTWSTSDKRAEIWIGEDRIVSFRALSPPLHANRDTDDHSYTGKLALKDDCTFSGKVSYSQANTRYANLDGPPPQEDVIGVVGSYKPDGTIEYFTVTCPGVCYGEKFTKTSDY